MSSDSKTPDPTPPDPRLAALRAKSQEADRQAAPTFPPSKPLQIFLLVALIITGLAYVVDQWSVRTSEQAHKKQAGKLKRLVELQERSMAEIKLGREAESRKQFSEAVLHFQKALQAQDNAGGHFYLGEALLHQGQPDNAFAEFKEAIHQDPEREKFYAAWGNGLIAQGKTDEAVQVDRNALQRNPNFGLIHFELAEALESQRQIAQAAEREAENGNRQPEAATDAAEAARLGADAVGHYARAGELGINTADFWQHYGALLFQQEKFADAEMSLTKAVAQNPQSGSAQFQLAAAEAKQGKDGEAIGHDEAALSLMPDDSATLNNLALIYATSTNAEIRSSKMAILLATRANDATTSQNARFMDTLARCYAADGDFSQATAWEEKAIHRANQLADHEMVNEFNSRYWGYLQHKAK